MMLLAADIFMHVLHLTIIAFNLTGWMFRATRKLHRVVALLTTFCWLAIGWWVGAIGYCPLTDWHWQIKRAQIKRAGGDDLLPHSYIDYLLQMVGLHFNPIAIDVAVGVVFGLTLLVTLALWGMEYKKAGKR